MTDDELNDHQKNSIADGFCPDCGYRGFALGPKGGAMLNIECGNLDCRARFNVLVDFINGQRIISHRIAREGHGGSHWGNPLEDRRRRTS